MLSPKEEAEWFGAESFEAQDCGWCGDKIVGGGTREGEKVCSACVVAYDKENNRGSPCVVCGEKTEMGAYSYGKGEWVSICSKDCELDYDDYEAESFNAETTIAKQYGETLDNLDDLQKIVKKTISPKRKPTKFIKDAKSSVVDSWKQMGKDGFRRQMYEPMEFEAEIPKSVKLGFGFGAGLALFQVAVIGSAIGLGMLLNKE